MRFTGKTLPDPIPLKIQFPFRYPRLLAIFKTPFSPVSKTNLFGTTISLDRGSPEYRA